MVHTVFNIMQSIQCCTCAQFKEKYIEIYNEFISQISIMPKAVRILAKGYLPISLITPSRLKGILTTVKQNLIKTNPDYDIVIK